jgi:hypothetical protein
MFDLLRIIQVGGIWIYLTLALSGLSALLVFVWIFLTTIGKKQVSPLIVFIPIGLTIFCALSGYFIGISQTMEAVSFAPADTKDSMTWTGTSISLSTLIIPVVLVPCIVIGTGILWLYNLVSHTRNTIATIIQMGTWGLCLLISLLATPIGIRLGIQNDFVGMTPLGGTIIALCLLFVFISRTSTQNETVLKSSFVCSMFCAISICILTLAQQSLGGSEALQAMANAPAEIKMVLTGMGFMTMKQAQLFFAPVATLAFAPTCFFISQMRGSDQIQSLISMLFIIISFFGAYYFSAPDTTVFTELLSK